jgi:hypothetical protein
VCIGEVEVKEHLVDNPHRSEQWRHSIEVKRWNIKQY